MKPRIILEQTTIKYYRYLYGRTAVPNNTITCILVKYSLTFYIIIILQYFNTKNPETWNFVENKIFPFSINLLLLDLKHAIKSWIHKISRLCSLVFTDIETIRQAQSKWQTVVVLPTRTILRDGFSPFIFNINLII